MSGRAFLCPDMHGCCAATASKLSPTMHPCMHRSCIVRVPKAYPNVRAPCRQAAAEALRLRQSDVQTSCRQHAAPSAPALPSGQRCALGARLAASRSRGRVREAETEGQIKGVARPAPPRQSARGFAAAPQGLMRVPRRDCSPHGSDVCNVPLRMCCATVRWSHHG